jgi:hypothetical protein
MSSRHSDLPVPTCTYRLMLWLYPPGFRLHFGQEMLQVFQDCYPGRAGDGRLARRLAFWYATLMDLLRSLPGEWRQALVRPRSVELPIRDWADALVIPFTVLGYLMAEGNLGAALVRIPLCFSATHGGGDAWPFAGLGSAGSIGTGMLIAFTLAVLGTASAVITARNNRAEIWSLKLS